MFIDTMRSDRPARHGGASAADFHRLPFSAPPAKPGGDTEVDVSVAGTAGRANTDGSLSAARECRFIDTAARLGYFQRF